MVDALEAINSDAWTQVRSDSSNFMHGLIQLTPWDAEEDWGHHLEGVPSMLQDHSEADRSERPSGACGDYDGRFQTPSFTLVHLMDSLNGG